MEAGKLETTSAERDGKWFTFPGSDLRLKIASVNSETYQRLLRKKLQAKRRELGGLELSDDLDEQVTTEAMGEAILLGWEGLTEGGVPVPYSAERSVALLKKSTKLSGFVVRTATRQASYEEVEIKAAEDNLGNC